MGTEKKVLCSTKITSKISVKAQEVWELIFRLSSFFSNRNLGPKTFVKDLF
jgi:hypothetical protein